jgi:nucleotide-binding universal stress UspA family protein
MKILVAVDQHPYSAYAVGEVAKLAANTWANVSLLGVQSNSGLKKAAAGAARLQTEDGPLPQALFDLHRHFLSHFDQQECPYTQPEGEQALIQVKKGVFEASPASVDAKKKLTLRLRIGNAGREVITEAREEQSDLIVLGCDPANGCSWENPPDLPRKVANDAPCSVLVVKKNKPVKRIVCCLDHDRVSQASLEMINQMVTLHDAQLTIIGLAASQSLKTAVEAKLDGILRYYQAREIDPWFELVEIDSLDAFIARESHWGLLALWMGKQSILEKAFPRGKVNKLIKGGDASVLILR